MPVGPDQTFKRSFVSNSAPPAILAVETNEQP
jgi:hypothetical protein